MNMPYASIPPPAVITGIGRAWSTSALHTPFAGISGEQECKDVPQTAHRCYSNYVTDRKRFSYVTWGRICCAVNVLDILQDAARKRASLSAQMLSSVEIQGIDD